MSDAAQAVAAPPNASSPMRLASRADVLAVPPTCEIDRATVATPAAPLVPCLLYVCTYATVHRPTCVARDQAFWPRALEPPGRALNRRFTALITIAPGFGLCVSLI